MITIFIVFLSVKYWEVEIDKTYECTEFFTNEDGSENVEVYIKGVYLKSLLRHDVMKVKLYIGDKSYPDLSTGRHIKPYFENGNSRISKEKRTDMVEQMIWETENFTMLPLDYFYWIPDSVGMEKDYFGHMYFDKDMQNIAIVKFEETQITENGFSWTSSDNYKLIVSKANRVEAVSLMNDVFKVKLND